jgi:hypothetical protein
MMKAYSLSSSYLPKSVHRGDHRTDIARYYGKALVRVLSSNFKDVAPVGTSKKSPDISALPANKDEWLAQQRKLKEQEKRADESEKQVRPALETFKQMVAVVVPTPASELVSAMLDSVVDGVAEDLYERIGPFPDKAYSAVVNILSQKLNFMAANSKGIEVAHHLSEPIDLDEVFKRANESLELDQKREQQVEIRHQEAIIHIEEQRAREVRKVRPVEFIP